MRVIKAAVIVLSLLIPTVAFAGTNSTSTTATATATAACQVGAASLNFGTYDPIGTNKTADLTQSTTINVSCTNGTNPASTSLTSTNGGTLKTTPDNGTPLSYTFSLTPPSSFKTGIAQLNPYTIAGTIAHGQNPKASGSGTYQDTLVLTVNF